MDDAAHTPAHAAPRGRSTVVSRRGLLLGGGALVLACGGGVAMGALQAVAPDKKAQEVPLELHDALTAESALIASIDATTGGSPAVRVALRQIRADHVAHRTTLQRMVDAYPRASAVAHPQSSAPAQALTVAELRSAEQRASTGAAARAARLPGKNATVLASIAACEASHAELFA